MRDRTDPGQERNSNLSRDLYRRVLDRLGFDTAPEITTAGLARAYRAWGETIPFDNAAKLVALRTNTSGNLPGIDAVEFFENFLEHGVGATCWPSSNALLSLLTQMGFDARRLAGSMRDTGVISHGTTRVCLDGQYWLVDSSMLTGILVPLNQELFVSGDPLWSVETEYDEGSHIIWWDSVPAPEYIPCRLLSNEVTYDFYLERYEASRIKSPFNERIYARINRPHEILVISGNRRFLKTAAGVEGSLLSETQLEQSLADEIGFSGAMIDRLRKCGALAASMIPNEGPPPPPTRPRPSRRGIA
ncbi:MAG TPA: arylamine N-acetyltransferase [Gemmatimonadaceae bacterium]